MNRVSPYMSGDNSSPASMNERYTVVIASRSYGCTERMNGIELTPSAKQVKVAAMTKNPAAISGVECRNPMQKVMVPETVNAITSIHRIDIFSAILVVYILTRRLRFPSIITIATVYSLCPAVIR